MNTIKYIAVTNGYDVGAVNNILRKHKKRRKNINGHGTRESITRKYITTPYTHFMPKVLGSIFNKNSNINVTYKTTNHIMNNLRVHGPTNLEHKTGVYKLLCDDCDAFYIGQTGRGFLKRFTEHRPPTYFHSLDYIRSKFAKHLIIENHNYTNFKTNLIPLHICKKGRHMNAPEAVSYTHLDVYKRQPFVCVLIQ